MIRFKHGCIRSLLPSGFESSTGYGFTPPRLLRNKAVSNCEQLIFDRTARAMSIPSSRTDTLLVLSTRDRADAVTSSNDSAALSSHSVVVRLRNRELLWKPFRFNVLL